MGILDSLPPAHSAVARSSGALGKSTAAMSRPRQQLMQSTTAANIVQDDDGSPLARVDWREQKIEGLKWLVIFVTLICPDPVRHMCMNC